MEQSTKTKPWIEIVRMDKAVWLCPLCLSVVTCPEYKELDLEGICFECEEGILELYRKDV